MADWLGFVVVIGIFLVMAGFSCTIEMSKFFSYIKKPKAILIGLFCQYGLLPLSAYFISQILNFDSLHSIALIITGSCPGGTLSNFWCWFFGADLELSIAMTASSSLLSFVFLSINCLIYMPLVTTNHVKIDYASLALSVSSLIGGVIFGLFIGHKTKRRTADHNNNNNINNNNINNSKWVKCKIRKSLIILGGISMIITLLLGAYENTLVSSVPAYMLPFEIFIGGIMLNGTSWIFSFILSYFICQLSHNQSITVCIECANQNVGLSIAIILLTMVNKDDADIAVGVPMYYGVLNAVTIFIFGTILRLCGFIENKDDEINHKFANSGFTKLCQFINNRRSNTSSNTIIDGVGGIRMHRTVNSSSSTVQLKSITPDLDIDDVLQQNTNTINNNNTLNILDPNNISMLMEEYEMARTPSNEEVAVKQRLKNDIINKKKTLRITTNDETIIINTKITKRKKSSSKGGAGDSSYNTPLTEDDEGEHLQIISTEYVD